MKKVEKENLNIFVVIYGDRDQVEKTNVNFSKHQIFGHKEREVLKDSDVVIREYPNTINNSIKL